MAKVIAVTSIHRALSVGKAKTATQDAVKPKVQIIQAGTIFISEGDELAELRALGAVRDPGKDEKVQVSVDNIVADGEGGVTKKTTTTTTKSGSGSTGKGSTAATGGEGREAPATGAKAGEGAGSGDSDLV